MKRMNSREMMLAYCDGCDKRLGEIGLPSPVDAEQAVYSTNDLDLCNECLPAADPKVWDILARLYKRIAELEGAAAK